MLSQVSPGAGGFTTSVTTIARFIGANAFTSWVPDAAKDALIVELNTALGPFAGTL